MPMKAIDMHMHLGVGPDFMVNVQEVVEKVLYRNAQRILGLSV
jgi:predicted TIM-barrel fold metal-dependent hydrolase